MKAVKWAVALLGIAAIAALALSRLTPAPILIENAALAPMGAGLALTLSLTNDGGPDRLIGARSPQAGSVSALGGALPLAVPAGARPSLAMDGAHLMLSGVSGAVEDGRLIPLTLEFERAGEVATQARIDTAGAMDHGAMTMGKPLGGPPASLRVEPEGAGWRVSLGAPGLALSADGADGPHQPGVGHGHLYLNGLKLQRLYQPTALIGALPPGRHVVAVTLNTNDHQPYMADGAAIRLEQVIEVR